MGPETVAEKIDPQEQDSPKLELPPKSDSKDDPGSAAKRLPVKKAQMFVVKNGQKIPVIVRKTDTKPEDRKLIIVKSKEKKETGAVAEITNSKPLDLQQLLNSQFSSSTESFPPIPPKTEVPPPINLQTLLNPIKVLQPIVPWRSEVSEPPKEQAAESSIYKPTKTDYVKPRKRGRPSKSTKNHDFEYDIDNKSFEEAIEEKASAKVAKKGQDSQEPSSSAATCKCDRLVTILMRQMTRITNRLDSCQAEIANLRSAKVEKEKRELTELNDAQNEIARLQSQLIIQRTMNSRK